MNLDRVLSRSKPPRLAHDDTPTMIVLVFLVLFALAWGVFVLCGDRL